MLKTALCSWGGAVGLLAFGMMACAVPDRLNLPEEITAKEMQVLVLWDTSKPQPGSLRAFRPADLFFDLPEQQRFFAIAASSTASLPQFSLQFERGPWLSLGEFDEQCELTESGFDCNLNVPAEIQDETIFGLCREETRFQSLRLGCVAQEEDKDQEDQPVRVLEACSNRVLPPVIDPPRPPLPPTLPIAASVSDRPSWVECSVPLQVPRLADGQCGRIVAPCESGPWPAGDPGDQHVDMNAAPGGNGTRGAPFRTIEEAVGRPGAILLAAGSYQLSAATQLNQTVRGLCPDQTRLVAEIHLDDASLEQLTLEGTVFVVGEATIEDVAVEGRVSTLARTQLHLRSSIVRRPVSATQPALVSRGTSLFDSVGVVAPGAVGIEVLAGRAEAAGLTVSARPTVRVSSPAGLKIEQSWLHGELGRPTLVSNGLATVSGRDLFVEGPRTGIEHTGRGSFVLRQTTIEAGSFGLTSTTTPIISPFQTAGTVRLEDVKIRTRSEGSIGLRIARNRLTAQRLQVDGPAVYSIEADNTADIAIEDLVVNNPGYESRIADQANPGQTRIITSGTGVYWNTNRLVTTNLDLKRALISGTPGLALLLGHDLSEVANDRTQRATATIEDVTIIRNEVSGRLGGGVNIGSVDTTFKRLQNQSPSTRGSFGVDGRGLYELEDFDIRGDVSPALLVIQSRDPEGVRKELQFTLRRMRAQTRGPKAVISMQASRIDAEDIDVDSTQTEDPDTFGDPALRFSGPSEEPVPLGARFERIQVRSNFQRSLRVDDFRRSVPELTHVSAEYTGPGGIDAVHFEDSSFNIDGLRITGKLTGAVGSSSDGTLPNPGKIILRNVIADGPESFYIAVEDPCEQPPETMCNLAIKDADYFILHQGIQRLGLCD